MKALNLFLFCIGVALVLPSCVSSKKFNELQAEKDALASSLAEAQEQIGTLESDKEALEAQTAQLNDDINGLKDDLKATADKIAAVEKSVAEKEAQLMAMKETVSNAFDDYKSLGLDVTERDGYMVLSGDNKIFFRSGSAKINKTGREIVEKLGKIIADNPDVSIAVSGHTDNRGILNAEYSDNWDLSAARANNVVSALIKHGVNASQLVPIAWADTRPAMEGDQDSKEVREANRRTEFVVLPDVEALHSLVKD